LVITEDIRIDIYGHNSDDVGKAAGIYAGLIKLCTERLIQAERTFLRYLTGLSCWGSGSESESGERDSEYGFDEHRRSRSSSKWSGSKESKKTMLVRRSKGLALLLYARHLASQ
jgi:hypothetical protein